MATSCRSMKIVLRSCRHLSTVRCTLACGITLDGRPCHFAHELPGLFHGQSFVSLQVQQAIATVAMVADGGMPKPEAITATWSS